MSNSNSLICEKYEIIKLLGQGSYGKAYLSKDKSNNV
jgi:serine/threonine protein kinase